MQQLSSVNNNSERPKMGLDESGVSIGDLLGSLRSRLTLILGCTLACIVCSLIYLHVTKSIYAGAATIRIDPGRASSLGLSDLGATGTSDADGDLHTEIAVLKSDGVALRTLRSLSDSTFHNLTGVSKAKANLPEGVDSLSPSQQDIINAFEASTDAKPVEGTSLVSVSVRATDPKTAAAVTNSLVDAYIVQSFTSRDRSVAELKTWLSAQMATLKTQVDAAQSRLAAFQEANNIIGTAGGTNDDNTVTDRLRILNQSLASAEADRIEKEARVHAALKADPSVLATLFPDPTLNTLQASQVQLQARASELSSKFGSRYPPLVEVNRQLVTLNSQVEKSESAVRNRLQQEYDASKAIQDMLQKQYDAQTRIAFGVNRNQAEYAVLQGDVTTSRELYDLLRRKMQQASIDADISGLKTVLVDSSRVPVEPVAPKKLLILLGSAILGIFAGIAAAFIGEAGSDEIRTNRQVEGTVGVPVLGTLPRVQGVGGQLVTLSNPASREAEAYRGLRAALLASQTGKSRTLVLASCSPNEGAAEVTANLAVSLAQAGHRVLAVDTDMRLASLHREFSIDNSVGLSSALMGPTSQITLVHPVKELSSLSVIPAGPTLGQSSERLSSELFRSLVAQWEDSFDFILLQTAPLLVVSDGVVLAGLADSVLIVARYGVSRAQSLVQARVLLDRVGARICGATIVDAPQANTNRDSYGKAGDAYFR